MWVYFVLTCAFLLVRYWAVLREIIVFVIDDTLAVCLEVWKGEMVGIYI